MNTSLLNKKIEYWENRLLDLGKRNKMISYKETKRATLKIVKPEFNELYQQIVTDEKEITFQKAIDKDADYRVYSILSLLDKLSAPIEVNIGDIRAEGTMPEIGKTLKHLRSKSRLAMDEQGTNILYLVFGFIEWREKGGRTDNWIKSPLILVPVSLQLSSINAPYTLKKYDDEVVVNPTLAYLFERDYGIILPEFDSDKDQLDDFMKKIEEIVDARGWRIHRECSIGLVSFLKISMYNDLIKNADQLIANPIVRAFAGEKNEVNTIQDDFFKFDHDKGKSIDSFQVLDADSSQQDAIMLSQRGVSFVMQGPPGTGKSQTITNIIAQALADGKKILFVSEKMAALDVVHRRLTDVNLADFCLSLHSHKANKKDILNQLGKNLSFSRIKVKDEEIAKLTQLDMLREQLKKYVHDIHTEIMPLEMSLYEVYGAIIELRDMPDISIDLVDVDRMSKDQVNRLALIVSNLDKAKTILGPQWYKNPWQGVSCGYLEVSQKRDLENKLDAVIRHLGELEKLSIENQPLLDLTTLKGLDDLWNLCEHAKFCLNIPHSWFTRTTENEEKAIQLLHDRKNKIKTFSAALTERFDRDFFEYNGAQLLMSFNTALANVRSKLRHVSNDADAYDKLEYDALKMQRAIELWTDVSVGFETIKQAYNLTIDASSIGVANTFLVIKYLLQKRNYTKHYFGQDNIGELRREIDNVCLAQENLRREEVYLAELNCDSLVNDEKVYEYQSRLTSALASISAADPHLTGKSSFYEGLAALDLKAIKRVEDVLIGEKIEKFCEEFGASKPESLSEVNKQIAAIPYIQQARYVSGWEKKEERIRLRKYISDLMQRHNMVHVNKERLEEYFTRYGILMESSTFDSEGYNALKTAYRRLHKNPEACPIIHASQDEEAYKLLDRIAEYRKELNELKTIVKGFKDDQDIVGPGDQSLLDYILAVRAKAQACKPVENWIESTEAAFGLVTDVIRSQEDLMEQRKELTCTYEEAVFDLDYAGMLNRFKADYTGFLKHFKSAYKNDIKQVRLLYKAVQKKITDDEIIELLQKLRQYHEKLQQYNSYAEKTSVILGVNEYAIDQDWELVRSRLDAFNDFCTVFRNRKAALFFIDNNEKWDEIIAQLKRIDELEKWFAENAQAKQFFASMYRATATDVESVRELLDNAKEACVHFDSPESYYKYLSGMGTDHGFAKFDKTATQYLEDRAWLYGQRERIKKALGIDYSEDAVDWNTATLALNAYDMLVAAFGETVSEKLVAKREDCKRAIQNYCDELEIIGELNDISKYVYGASKLQKEIQDKSIHTVCSEMQCVIKGARDVVDVFKYLESNDGKAICNDAVSEVKRVLDSALYCRQTTDELNSKDAYLRERLGSDYDGLYTDWSRIKENLKISEKINTVLGSGITNELIDAFINATSVYNEIQMDDLSEKNEEICRIEEEYKEFKNYSLLPDKIVVAEDMLRSITIARDIKQNVAKVAFSTCTYGEFIDGLRKLAGLQEARKAYSAELYAAQRTMPFLQLHEDMEWSEVIEMFDHMKQIKRAIATRKIEGSIANWLTNAIEDLDINDYYEKIKEFMRYKGFCYDIISLFETQSMFESFTLTRLLRRFRNCSEQLGAMDAWIDYRDCKIVCGENGLHDFAMQAEDTWYPEGRLKDVFLKAFYYDWFECVCKNIDSVANFRVRTQESRVEAFRELDAHQLPVDQMRIRERLLREMPSMNSFGRATDEMSILLHELGKKRNIMPLRKLFRAIPNLLLKLKPCLMMSPLSVSYFLEADTYRFDMVIFDEASQIFPQDAIGAIFRGSQVIIAGDSKQLPPTNFFAASTSNDMEYDVDDDYEEEIIFDSILEEATNSLPNRSLLWHYRSRYEDLISYSNQEIYQNNLITFPSSTTRVPDTGVEYVYVERGVYENRCNKTEAKEIVRLVAEHIRNHPDRSLGVIAFSESQQTVIEDEIHRFRAKNPKLEYFFNENADEPFFVKNLENVQGDERDTIIFSICYGRNAQGRMYMRFGPLGNQGGERRLNVAITRAKHNVKLVGSILPEDIDLEKTRSEGVKMLRGYINYALYGSQVLTKRNTKNKLYDVDVFSEQIGEFLTEKGYKVHMNVGNSDYTVDVALEHPEKAGLFFAGIECDGNTYYMARTVRDREHLRTSVLQRMGWNMHRVWSTEWIRNPQAEQERLLAFVQNALKSFEAQVNSFDAPAVQEEIEVEVLKQQPTKITKQDLQNPYKLEPYKEGRINSIKRFRGHDNESRIADMIHEVVRVEQPIHLDLLYKRLLPAFGGRSVTQSIRDTVLRVMQRNMKGEVSLENDFVRLFDLTEVQARRSQAGFPDRNIEHISIVEIAAAMKKILVGAFGMERVVLCSEAAKIFGFERSGQKIKQRTNEAVDYLVKNRIVSDVDDKIQLLEG